MKEFKIIEYRREVNQYVWRVEASSEAEAIRNHECNTEVFAEYEDYTAGVGDLIGEYDSDLIIREVEED